MGKTKEEKARLDGMSYALKIAKEQGIDGLEADIKRRGAYGIPVGLDNKYLEEFTNNVKLMTMDTIMCLTLVTLHDEFGFGTKRLQQFQDRFDFKASCFEGDFTNWDEQLAILREECGIELTIRENNKNVRVK